MDYFFYNTDADAFTEQPRPRYPVLIDEGFAAAGGDRQKYGEQLSRLSKDDILLMYENGVGLVAVGRVQESWDGVVHTEPRYYKNAEMSGLTGGPFEYRIAVEWFLDLSNSPFSVQNLRNRIGYQPRGTIRRIVEQRTEVAQFIEELGEAKGVLPGEITRPTQYIEGATRKISVNTYERNREAVIQCKASRGTACLICGFDFGVAYGPEFAGFIHVHHLKPLSEVASEYVVDPVTDLCPVCPNCHAVIHHGGRLRSIEEVQQLIKKQRE